MPLLIDYALCNQTVTVYRLEGRAVTRTVLARVYFEYGDALKVDRTGASSETGFLLIVPGSGDVCRPGDKVCLGEGPAVGVDVLSWWREFIPSKVPGLAVVRSVRPVFWSGVKVHTEARG
jgi:hypothetical protein